MAYVPDYVFLLLGSYAIDFSCIHSASSIHFISLAPFLLVVVMRWRPLLALALLLFQMELMLSWLKSFVSIV